MPALTIPILVLPQDGEAYIITSHNKLSHYLGMLTHQIPIESQFVKFLPDNLNAELVLGSVSTLKEACTWLGYTYLHVRMMRNPLAYGLKWEDVERDPQLFAHRKKLVSEAARQVRFGLSGSPHLVHVEIRVRVSQRRL